MAKCLDKKSLLKLWFVGTKWLVTEPRTEMNPTGSEVSSYPTCLPGQKTTNFLLKLYWR